MANVYMPRPPEVELEEAKKRRGSGEETMDRGLTGRLSGGVVPGSLPYDAPLQVRQEHEVPHAKHKHWALRMLAFMRRNKYPLLFATFVYVEFIGFSVWRVSPKDADRIVTLRRRLDNKVVHSIEWRPPAKQAEIERAGSFSIVDKKLPSLSALPVAQDRPPLGERAYYYLQSFFPNPYFNRLNETADGQNALQYNRLLYYIQEYEERHTTLLPIDEVTNDKLLSVHMALKVVFRTERIKVRDDNVGHPLHGLYHVMLDTVAESVVDDWVKEQSSGDLKLAPSRRLRSSLDASLGNYTDQELMASIGRSGLAHQEYMRSLDPEAMPSEEEYKRGLPAEALEADEILRRTWAASIEKRSQGKAVVEDIMWKMTLTDIEEPSFKGHITDTEAWEF